jgi:hypothetical protein
MAHIFHGIAVGFDWLQSLLAMIDPWVGMIVISALTAILVLYVYKYTSNQPAITKAKNRIKANLLAMSLYRDSMKVIFSSAGGIVLVNFRYLSLNLVPLVCMILPVGIVMANLDGWYGYRPLRVGEQRLVEAEVDEELVMSDGLELIAPEGLEVDAPPVRVPSEGRVFWRVEAVEPGSHELRVAAGGRSFAKRVRVDGELARLSPLRHSGGMVNGFLYPGESVADGESGVSAVGVDYPATEMALAGTSLHWVYVYLVLTLVFAFALRGMIGVTF